MRYSHKYVVPIQRLKCRFCDKENLKMRKQPPPPKKKKKKKKKIECVTENYFHISQLKHMFKLIDEKIITILH